MFGYCEKCKRTTEQAVIKNKRGVTRVYCIECREVLRPPTKSDLLELRVAAKRSKEFISQYI